MNNSDTNQAEQLRENAVITGAFLNEFTLKTMIDFVFMLRNRITSELVRDFPMSFKTPIYKGSQDEIVKDILAIDAIQWKLTGEYEKFLKKERKLSMFIPCDSFEKPLKEPKRDDFLTHGICRTDEFTKAINEFEIAKNKVLFKDFYLKNDEENNLCLFHKKHEWSIAKIEPKFIWGRINEFTLLDIANNSPKLHLFVLNENGVSCIFR